MLVYLLLGLVWVVRAFPGDPVYPTPLHGFNATKRVYVVSPGCLASASLEVQVALETLQGYSARYAPLLALNYTNTAASLFLNEIAGTHGVEYAVADACGNLSSVVSLVRAFTPLSGYVRVSNVSDGEVLGAVNAVNAIEGAGMVVSGKEVEEAAVAAGLRLAYDATGQSWEDVVAALNGTTSTPWSRHSSCLQDPSKAGSLLGFCVVTRALAWWTTNGGDPNDPATRQALGQLIAPAAVYGWGLSEFETVQAASANGAWVHASDWAHNLAFTSSFSLPAPSPPAPPPPPPAAPPQKHTVAFVMSDGDNVQWITNSFLLDPRWWAGERGKVAISWTLSPALFRLIPAAMHYMFSTATPLDSFVAAPSGIGYAYPDCFTASFSSTFAAFSSALMQPTGLRVANVIAKTFSQDAANTLLASDHIDALLWYDYSSYSALQGNVSFSPNGKPSIGARFQLWTGTFDNVSSLSQKLLQLPADPLHPQGYSLIALHAWTNSVADAIQVAEIVNKAAPGKFDFVSAETLANRVRKYVANDAAN